MKRIPRINYLRSQLFRCFTLSVKSESQIELIREVISGILDLLIEMENDSTT
jgi:hypothetical protein